MFSIFPPRRSATHTVSRHKRDPNSPVLAAAIAKRERRADKLQRDAFRSFARNDAHRFGPTFDPFFITK